MIEKKMAIDWHHSELTISKQCELLELSKGALYYNARPENEYNLELMDLIDRQYLETPFYGSRQMKNHLVLQGHKVNRKRIKRLMQLMGLRAVYPGPNTSKRNHEHKVYPYLLRGMKIDCPNLVWATDITYVRLNKGFAYLVAIIDWYSRFVLSWQLSNTLSSSFCVDSILRAFEAHGEPLIVNTDQGCQFTSRGFTEAIENKGVLISMDGKGRALDNVMIERLWRSLKYEEIYLKGYNQKSYLEAERGIQKYFNFYNNNRPHQSIGNVTPRGFHELEVGAKERELLCAV